MGVSFWLTVEVDAGGLEPERITLFDSNTTHNLAQMAGAAGIYEAIWRPEEMGAVYGGDLIEKLEIGLAEMKEFPGKYKKFNAENGWGTYDQFVPIVEEYLKACKKYPKAKIGVWR